MGGSQSDVSGHCEHGDMDVLFLIIGLLVGGAAGVFGGLAYGRRGVQEPAAAEPPEVIAARHAMELAEVRAQEQTAQAALREQLAAVAATADGLRESIRRQQQQYEELAERQRQELIHQAREQAEAERHRLLAEAERAAERRREEAQQALARDRAEALKALVKSCEGPTFIDRRDMALMRLFFDAGPRRGEVAGLDVDDIDYPGGMVKVIGKGRRERWIPIGPKTVAALDRYRRARGRHPHAADRALWLGTWGR